MKLASLLALTLSATVLATPTVESRSPTPVKRDLSSITGILSSISNKVDSLHTAIKNYNGGGNTQPVESASDKLVDSINSGTKKVKGTNDLNGMDALGLQQPVSDLKDEIQSTISDLNGKKKQLVAAGKGDVTLADLKKQKSAALDLSDAIVSKVPDNLHDIAHNLASGISDAIQKGIDEFQDAGKSNSANNKNNKKFARQPDTTASASSGAGQMKPTSSSLFGSTSSAAASSSTPSSSNTAALTGAASMNKMSGSVGAVAFAAMAMVF